MKKSFMFVAVAAAGMLASCSSDLSQVQIQRLNQHKKNSYPLRLASLLQWPVLV